MFDVIIVGGGPSGLSAALILGRCRRSVLVCDNGHPRNAAARHMHGFLSRDGIDPKDLTCFAREDLLHYDVQIMDQEVQSACQLECNGDTRFEIRLADGREFQSRKLLLATGVRDTLPSIIGVAEYYGRGVYHCPYCDAWEHSDQRLAAYGDGTSAAGLAECLLNWSHSVTACTDGAVLTGEEKRRLTQLKIDLREEKIDHLEGPEGADGMLQRISFVTGKSIPCDALFFNTSQFQRSALPHSLGCECDDSGPVATNEWHCTSRGGLYVAGDAGSFSGGDVQFVIHAAAKGAKAAVGINKELQQEDLDRMIRDGKH